MDRAYNDEFGDEGISPDGVLSTYRKQKNLTAEDIIQKDFRYAQTQIANELHSAFSGQTTAQRQESSKVLMDRMRLNKEFLGDRSFVQSQIDQE